MAFKRPLEQGKLDFYPIFTMGKKRVGESSQALSLSKKSSRSSFSSNAPSRTAGAKHAYPLILPPSIRGLVFVNEK